MPRSRRPLNIYVAGFCVGLLTYPARYPTSSASGSFSSTILKHAGICSSLDTGVTPVKRLLKWLGYGLLLAILRVGPNDAELDDAFLPNLLMAAL